MWAASNLGVAYPTSHHPRTVLYIHPVQTWSSVECVGVAPGVCKLRQLRAKLHMEWE